MTYTLTAKNVELENDGFSLTLAFADEQMGEGGYVMLQKGLESDEQDKKFGFDKVHIEVGTQKKSGYGGISQMLLSDAMLRIELTEKGKQFLQMQEDILVSLPIDDPKLEEKLRKFAAAIDGEFPFEIG
jgi:hypothetical protein